MPIDETLTDTIDPGSEWNWGLIKGGTYLSVEYIVSVFLAPHPDMAERYRVFICLNRFPQIKCNTRSIFKQAKAGLKREFCFSYTDCCTNAKGTSLPPSTLRKAWILPALYQKLGDALMLFPMALESVFFRNKKKYTHCLSSYKITWKLNL